MLGGQGRLILENRGLVSVSWRFLGIGKLEAKTKPLVRFLELVSLQR
jgi:hypothetical protein